jgi:hypothetical protein
MAELSQLSLRALAVAPRAASVERCRRALKFGHGTIGFAGSGERPARNRARQRGLDRGSGSVGRISRGQGPFRSQGSITSIEAGSERRRSALTRRAWACSYRPRKRSTLAHAVATVVLSALGCPGTSATASSAAS